jgi:KDO2-lipid IV(A) lauroyltransferase
MTRLGVALIWLLRFLPLPVLARVGEGFGLVLYALGRERRRVARTNLALCFPDASAAEREALVREAFMSFARSLLERGIAWWSSAARIQRLVQIEGLEHFLAHQGRPVILLAPHFVALDMGWARLTSEYSLTSMYSNQKNPLFNRIMYEGRLRFGGQLFSRQEGLRPVVRLLRQGRPFYYLPDLDYGPNDAVFVPFFGVSAATITGLSRLAALSKAVVIPCVTRFQPGGRGYVTRFYPAWEGFPGEDIEQDTRRMNAFIEDCVREAPGQYFWLHKRFKTRPAGEARFYP